MDKLVQTLGITSPSKPQVSRMAADLNGQVAAFRTLPLGDAGPFTFVAADALTMKVRGKPVTGPNITPLQGREDRLGAGPGAVAAAPRTSSSAACCHSIGRW